MNLIVTTAADEEFQSALRFYADRSADVADDLLMDFRGVTTQLLQFPKSGQRLSGGVRRLLFRQFPFQLIYRVEGDNIVVYAVAHQKLRPGYWRDRVLKR